MSGICNSLLRPGRCAALLALLGWLTVPATGRSQESPSAPPATEAPDPPPVGPQGYVNLVNATGLEGEIRIVFDGKAETALELPIGSDTGMTGFPPGQVSILITHPKAPAALEKEVTLKLAERTNLVIHTTATADSEGKPAGITLQALTLPSSPTPGKNTISLINCDALGRQQFLALNGTEVSLPSLSAVHLMEVPQVESYTLTFKGHDVMGPYVPLAPDHVYFIVYVDLQNPRLNGLVVMDRKAGSPAEELDRKKREVAQRIARERKAADWVLSELAKRTQERTDAREQRQKQRAEMEKKQ